jgi:hypothetical protein
MATVHELTELFNQLAAEAHDKGVAAWARHHRSDFSSRAVADAQLEKLRKELSGATPVHRHEPVGRSRNFTTRTTTQSGEVIRHLSMARDWVRAVELAMWSMRSDHPEELGKLPAKVVVTEE